MYTVLIQTFLCITFIRATTIEEYHIKRAELLEREANTAIGGTLKLSEEEIKVNEILIKLKEQEHNQSFHDYFSHPNHYFTYYNHIKTSKVFQTLKRMPKGAALHTHATFLLDADAMLNLTYEDQCYICYTDNDLIFHFAEQTPLRPCDVNWTLASELRDASGDVAAFDQQLKKHFTLICDEGENCPTELDDVWQKFDRTHLVTKSLITYRPVREKYIYKCLKKFYDDNVMYAEMRTGLHVLYELNGTKHDAEYTIKLHRDVTNRFIEDHPDFIGVKLIITKHRASSTESVKYVIDMTKTLKKNYPDIIAGFDLVGQEDRGRPLTDFLPLLLEAKDDLNFYFHAGETDWFGRTSDENLVDAVLLGTKRIGHGYALVKHPVLMEIMKQENIAVEVNVISNAVLALTEDLREHPLASFIAGNLPVVLSSDDPGVWGADPLSHDFYVVFMAVASNRADLRLLKQLALNSIRYSALENKRKVACTKVFEKRWKQFLQEELRNEFDIS
ncbi:adenosine/AMP deaminase domain-containing protein [Phthorimaea operculella]|nr:adenosine/AMP deaminase domain-containing protein [Phthorimaea operculella]